MKKVISFLLAAVLLIGAAPATQAQKNKPLTTKEANQVLQRIVGNWQVSYYVSQFGDSIFIETKGNVKFSKALPDDYVHEQFDIEQADGSTLQGEGFIRYSEALQRFELVQVGKKGKSIVVMVGKWLPEYNALSFIPVKGEGQWSRFINPKMQCVYLFKDDGTFMRLVRTFEKNNICKIVSQDHYSFPDVAKSN